MCSFCLAVFQFENVSQKFEEVKKQMRIEIKFKIGGIRVETELGNRILYTYE